MKKILIIMLLITSMNHSAYAFKKNNTFNDFHGFLDFNGYYDSRNYSDITLNSYFDTGNYFEYFSFINILGNPNDFKFQRYFTEQDFRLKYKKFPMQVEAQYATGTNFLDLWRFGTRINVHDIPKFKNFFNKLNLIYTPALYPLQIDKSKGYDAQIEHFYIIKIFPRLLKDRIYISGFVDHNLLFGSDNKSKHNKFVTENQLGIKLVKNLYFVLEQRFNQFYPKKKHGLGIGLEYKVRF